jgi:hypothetical protein
VQTPLGFSTLVVLISEVILIGLATRASGVDFTILILGILGLLFVLVFLVFRMTKAGPEDARGTITRSRKYDVFLSSVLAGYGDDSRLQAEQAVALEIATCLEQECDFVVYYAGREVTSAKDFDGTHIGARSDLQALRDSRYFLMLYPEKVTSSVLFEAGFALDHCQASVYLVHDQDHLPYLMRRLPEVNRTARIFTFDQPADILRMIKRHRKNLFDWIDDPSVSF